VYCLNYYGTKPKLPSMDCLLANILIFYFLWASTTFLTVDADLESSSFSSTDSDGMIVRTIPSLPITAGSDRNASNDGI
jgi:hypothetical protein